MSPILDPHGQPIGGDVDEADVIARMAAEIATLDLPGTTRTSDPCHVLLEVDPAHLFTLVGLVQLAARHPGLSDFHRDVAAEFVDMAKAFFGRACPTVFETICRGDDPAEDV
jgi:hypothetical protein